MASPQAARFQLQGLERIGPPGHRNLIWELHARYARPYDDTTILNVFHRTLDGGVSVLLERPVFHELAVALASERGEFTVKGVQTSAHLSWTEQGLFTRIWWHGSGRASEMRLDADQLQTVRAAMANMDAIGWAGWRSGAAGGWETLQASA